MHIDKEVLENLLGEKVSSFLISEGTKPGDNVAGSLISIKVNLESGNTLHLVNKTYPDDPEFKEFAIRFGLFTTENTLYQTVGPRVAALLKSKGLPDSKAELPLPKFISGNGDQTKGEEYLLLEDVRPAGYIMQDKFKGYNLPEVTLIMKELARYHASTYYWIKYEGEKIFEEDANLGRYKTSPFAANDAMMEMMGTEMFHLEVQNSVKVLEQNGFAELAGKVTTKLVNQGKYSIYQLIKQKTLLTDNSTFPCIIHGDLWVNNILLKYNSEGVPTSLKFIDFQQTRRGNIYEDLIYFVLTSTTPAFRKQYFPLVLNSYFEAFSSTLLDLKCPLPLGFTIGRLFDTFNSELLPGYVYMAFAIPMQLADPIDPKEKLEALQQQTPKSENGVILPQDQAPQDQAPPDPAQMMAMMMQGLQARSQMFFGQMMKSPKAINRLVDLTKEFEEMHLL